jgi:hypothetical protein
LFDALAIDTHRRYAKEHCMLRLDRHTAAVFTAVTLACAAALPLTSHAQQPVLAPLASGEGSTAPAPWRAVGLPRNKAPLAQMDVASVDGVRALRLKTEASYGTLVHELKNVSASDATLSWRWRLDQAVANADLRRKEGDDAALKVCVMFDMPLDQVPFGERTVLRLARSLSSELLPAATVCYISDRSTATGTTLANIYTRRVRSIITDGQGSPLAQWRTHERRIGEDFLKLFGDESKVVPPVVAVVVGADSDNTGGSSLAYIADLALKP